jgi:DNA-binding transcriptional ArsR family regulator
MDAMAVMHTMDLAGLSDNAGEAAAFLKLAANEKRLMILCHLLQNGETAVTALAAAVGLSQSALSQHLAGLKDAGLVSTRRQGQTIYYALADRRAVRLLKTLKQIFCP